MARTNIHIDDEVVGDVMRRHRLATKTEAVDMALRSLADRSMPREEALAMRGARSLDDVLDERPPVAAHPSLRREVVRRHDGLETFEQLGTG